MISQALQILAPFFAPPQCEACDQPLLPGEFLCETCQKLIKTLPQNHCQRCAEPFRALESTEHFCGECLKNSPAFSKVWAAYLYEGAVPSLIQYAKLNKRPLGLIYLAKQSVNVLNQAILEFQPDLLLPVPLSFWRSFKRGYNQSYLLAKAWRQEWKKVNLKTSRSGFACLPINVSVKRSHTKPAAQQKRSERLKLLKNVFQVHRNTLADKRVLIIDDVMTTGATVQALSIVLKRAKVQEVAVMVLARTAKWSK